MSCTTMWWHAALMTEASLCPCGHNTLRAMFSAQIRKKGAKGGYQGPNRSPKQQKQRTGLLKDSHKSYTPVCSRQNKSWGLQSISQYTGLCRELRHDCSGTFHREAIHLGLDSCHPDILLFQRVQLKLLFDPNKNPDHSMFLLTRGFPKHSKIPSIRGAFTSSLFPAILKTLFSLTEFKVHIYLVLNN